MDERKKVKKALAEKFGWENVSIRKGKGTASSWIYVRVMGDPENKELRREIVEKIVYENCRVSHWANDGLDGDALTIRIEAKGCREEVLRDVRERINNDPKIKGYIDTAFGFFRVKSIRPDWWVICDEGNGFTRSFACDPFTLIYIYDED